MEGITSRSAGGFNLKGLALGVELFNCTYTMAPASKPRDLASVVAGGSPRGLK
jgi:hypothetical protein